MGGLAAILYIVYSMTKILYKTTWRTSEKFNLLHSQTERYS